MAIYMKYGSIKGPVTTDGFKDWIELNSFQWGAGRAIGSATGHSNSREHSSPSFSEVTVRKRTDLSSPELFLEAVAGPYRPAVGQDPERPNSTIAGGVGEANYGR